MAEVLSHIGLVKQGMECPSLNSQAFVLFLISHCYYLQVSLCLSVESLEGSCPFKERLLLIWCPFWFTWWLWKAHLTSFTISNKAYIHFQLSAKTMCWQKASDSLMEESIHSKNSHPHKLNTSVPSKWYWHYLCSLDLGCLLEDSFHDIQQRNITS